MVKHVCVLALAVVLATCGTAFAASSLEGPTGIVNVPSTDLAEPGKGEIALTWQDLEGDFSRQIVRGVYGVAPEWEVGALWNKVKDGADVKTWGANVKYRLMREPKQDYGLAVGLAYADMSVDIAVPPPLAAPRAAQGPIDLSADAKWTRYYVVVSKKLGPPGEDMYGGEESALGQLTGLIGIVGDRLKVEGESSETDTNLMLGLETVSRDGTYFGIDWRPKWKDTGDSIISLVARRAIGQSLGAEIGWTNSVGPIGADDRKFFVGVSYMFGAGEEEGY